MWFILIPVSRPTLSGHQPFNPVTLPITFYNSLFFVPLAPPLHYNILPPFFFFFDCQISGGLDHLFAHDERCFICRGSTHFMEKYFNGSLNDFGWMPRKNTSCCSPFRLFFCHFGKNNNNNTISNIPFYALNCFLFNEIGRTDIFSKVRAECPFHGKFSSRSLVVNFHIFSICATTQLLMNVIFAVHLYHLCPCVIFSLISALLLCNVAPHLYKVYESPCLLNCVYSTDLALCLSAADRDLGLMYPLFFKKEIAL